jgi:hypothetical protein
MRAHSESERSVWYVFLMGGRVSNYHYLTPTFRTVTLRRWVNKGEKKAGDPKGRVPGTAWKARSREPTLSCNEPRDDTGNRNKNRALGH